MLMGISWQGANGLHATVAHNIGTVDEAQIDFTRLSIRADRTDLIASVTFPLIGPVISPSVPLSLV